MGVLKTYVLEAAMNPTAPIFQQFSKTQRQRLDKMQNWSPYIKTPVTMEVSENGQLVEKQRILRLKLNSNSVWQDEQIKEGILANEKFTAAEYAAVKFRYGVLQTNREIIQKFLEESPQFSEFSGFSQDQAKCFHLYDRRKEISSENQDFRKRLAAANKIMQLDLVEAEELLLQIFGSGYELPKGTEQERLEECQNALINHVDEKPNGIMDVMMSRTSADDKVSVLIGKAVNLGIISFEKITDAVAMNRSGSWAAVKVISNEYDIDDRQRHFGEFLLSGEGVYLKNDIEKEVSKKMTTKVVIEEPERKSVSVSDNAGEKVEPETKVTTTKQYRPRKPKKKFAAKIK